jgi:hypothetical protein
MGSAQLALGGQIHAAFPPDKFVELFGNEWNVLILHDGEMTETKLTER